jgi:hypothetical protein
MDTDLAFMGEGVLGTLIVAVVFLGILAWVVFAKWRND